MLWARLGYVESALEIAQQCEGAVNISSVVVASGSAGTHAGLAVGLEHLMPESELIGVTVSRSVADQLPKVVNLQQAIAKELELTASAEILLWDDYFARLRRAERRRHGSSEIAGEAGRHSA